MNIQYLRMQVPITRRFVVIGEVTPELHHLIAERRETGAGEFHGARILEIAEHERNFDGVARGQPTAQGGRAPVEAIGPGIAIACVRVTFLRLAICLLYTSDAADE